MSILSLTLGRGEDLYHISLEWTTYVSLKRGQPYINETAKKQLGVRIPQRESGSRNREAKAYSRGEKSLLHSLRSSCRQRARVKGGDYLLQGRSLVSFRLPKKWIEPDQENFGEQWNFTQEVDIMKPQPLTITLCPVCLPIITSKNSLDTCIHKPTTLKLPFACNLDSNCPTAWTHFVCSKMVLFIQT